MGLDAWIDRCVDMGLTVDAAVWATPQLRDTHAARRMNELCNGCGYSHGYSTGSGEGDGNYPSPIPPHNAVSDEWGQDYGYGSFDNGLFGDGSSLLW